MKRPILFLALAAVLSLTARAAPGDAFTYQGQLKQSGAPATGNYDLEFRLYAAASGGTALAGPVTVPNVSVSAGLFQTQLDFGQAPFGGAQRWLEIAVRPAGSGAYTTLTPRQELTATPYALRAKAVDSVPASAIPAGSITADKLAHGATATTVNTSAASIAATANTIYTASGSTAQAFTLPDTANTGDTIEISGTSTAGWSASRLFPNLWTPRESNR
ncbi:MAG: hypothetical protein HC845_11665 [Akkermansiaceae bacterium]|nr:hypothetical protein [Akkermansiaceae bacterium]